MATLIESGPLLISRDPHESLHPGQGHYGVTRLIESIGRREGRIKVYDKPLPEDRQMFYSELGAGWEGALEREFKRREGLRQKDADDTWVLQDKICFEGIHLVPDMYKSNKIGEAKLTFKRQPSRPDKLLDTFWSWGVQTKCYSHVLGIYTVEFFVCYLERWPTPVRYLFEYDPSECREAWDKIQKQADWMRSMENTEIK